MIGKRTKSRGAVPVTPSLQDLQDEQRPGAVDELSAARANEAQVYDAIYANDPHYKMGIGRMRDVNKALGRLFVTSGGGSLLDVGAGRGELIAMAREAGFTPVMGTEAARSLASESVLHAYAHQLPFDDRSFDHVFCCDVLEHVLPEDVPAAVRELWRVTGRTLTVSASTRPSLWAGRDLHISARPIEDWSALFAEVTGQAYADACGTFGGSPVWRFVRA